MDDGSELWGMVYIMNMIRPQPPTPAYYSGIHNAYVKLGRVPKSSGYWNLRCSEANDANGLACDELHSTTAASKYGGGLFLCLSARTSGF